MSARPSLSRRQATDRTIGYAARAGLAGAAAWFALGLESTVVGGEHHYRDAVWFVPWVLTGLAVAGLYLAQRQRLCRRGRVAFLALAITMLLVLVGQVGVIFDVPALAVLGFPVGALLWLVALVPVGVATWRVGVLPRQVAVLVAVLEPLSIANGVLLAPIAGLYDRGNYSGALAKGAVVLVLALGLRRLAELRTESIARTTSSARV